MFSLFVSTNFSRTSEKRVPAKSGELKERKITLPVMNDAAEGLISFLSAHETLGDELRLMGRRELTRCRLFGGCMCLDGVHGAAEG